MNKSNHNISNLPSRNNQLRKYQIIENDHQPKLLHKKKPIKITIKSEKGNKNGKIEDTAARL